MPSPSFSDIHIQKNKADSAGIRTGTFVVACHEPEVEQIGISFLRKIEYKGIAEVEFKKDSRNGTFKMIEVNTRIWTQNNLRRDVA